jgi:hypothetical protein
MTRHDQSPANLASKGLRKRAGHRTDLPVRRRIHAATRREIRRRPGRRAVIRSASHRWVHGSLGYGRRERRPSRTFMHHGRSAERPLLADMQVKNCGGSCWPGVMRISGSAHWCPCPGDSTRSGSLTRQRHSGSASTRTTPGGLGSPQRPRLAGADAGPGGWRGGGVAACPARRPRSCPAASIPGCPARGAVARGRVPGAPGLPGGSGPGQCRAASAVRHPVHRHRRRIRAAPIEDPQRLDERRAEAGLEPFADYEARMRAL